MNGTVALDVHLRLLIFVLNIEKMSFYGGMGFGMVGSDFLAACCLPYYLISLLCFFSSRCYEDRSPF